MRNFHRLSIIPFCFLVGACASSVEIRDETVGYQYTGEKFSKVELTVSQDATDDLEDLVRFDQDKFRARIERNLEVRGLLDVNSENSVKVEINDVRVRSSVSAIILGILAGTDHVRGDVSLIGSNHRSFHTFYVSATYGLGGIMGFKETRMEWIYDEFAELTLKEILGLTEPFSIPEGY